MGMLGLDGTYRQKKRGSSSYQYVVSIGREWKRDSGGFGWKTFWKTSRSIPAILCVFLVWFGLGWSWWPMYVSMLSVAATTNAPMRRRMRTKHKQNPGRRQGSLYTSVYHLLHPRIPNAGLWHTTYRQWQGLRMNPCWIGTGWMGGRQAIICLDRWYDRIRDRALLSMIVNEHVVIGWLLDVSGMGWWWMVDGCRWLC